MGPFDAYKGSLPYASELFGIYQPLLGWKSQITLQRYARARESLYADLVRRSLSGRSAAVTVRLTDTRTGAHDNPLARLAFDVEQLQPTDVDRNGPARFAGAIDSALARLVVRRLGPKPPADWGAEINETQIAERLDEVRDILSNPDKLAADEELSRYTTSFAERYRPTDGQALLDDLFATESKVAGYLLFVGKQMPETLDSLFFAGGPSVLAAAAVVDPMLSFGANNFEAILSPIGVIHLYREYFFELDSFLGPPVSHLWLSPGGTVELIEVSARKTLTETSLEQATETTTRSETETTTQDDIADAVKEQNRDNIRFGYTSTSSYTAAVSSASATADLSLERTTEASREMTHKRMREQSEKLSSEIKRNFKSTFRTLTETTDTSSKRYVISNGTGKLANYELRRKMRKVGVQVQDIGVALCWHTFVDDPARELGIAKLVHIGEPPELGDMVQPEAPPMPAAQSQEVSIVIPFVGKDTDDKDISYTDGAETEYQWPDLEEHIEAYFPQRATFPTPGYTLTAVDVAVEGMDALVSAGPLASADGSSEGTFTLHLDYVNWQGRDQVPTKVRLQWSPSQSVLDAVSAEYASRLSDYNVEKARRYKEAFYESARERIRVASEIKPRPSEDLREEERTVVYRTLVSQLMSVGPEQSKHVISELVRSIFDIDKMLYFVAPEWWTPRLHRSTQHLGEDPGPRPPRDFGGINVNIAGTRLTRADMPLGGGGSQPGTAEVAANSITSESIVDWGGSKELGRDSYYITEESAPAKLGSSLGWLLQLDGDNSRNAFLNSPWVKAVIPIRIGKERAALNWLEQASVEGADGLDEAYVASPGDPPELVSTPGNPVTIRDAVDFLIDKIHQFEATAQEPIEGDPADPNSAESHFAGSLPTEAVFEHGFYPLQGGVRFDQDGDRQAIFSQWMEILPTDQVAALEVEYDPKTLQVKEPPY
jgi:hypothetical protein